MEHRNKLMKIFVILKNMNDAMQQLQMFLLHWMANRNEELNEELLHVIIILLNNCEHTRMPGYCNWIHRYLNYDFFSLFRMTRESFDMLITKLNCNERYFKGGSPPVPIEQQVLMTLWWLGKGEALITIADRFNVSVSTVYKSSEYVLSRIINLQAQYIVWPDRHEAATIEACFREKTGYPGMYVL